MIEFAWSEEMSVGVPALDADHRCLVRIVNLLRDVEGEDARRAVETVLDTLVVYCRYHFAREERVMAWCRFPGVGVHRGEHEEFAPIRPPPPALRRARRSRDRRRAAGSPDGLAAPSHPDPGHGVQTLCARRGGDAAGRDRAARAGDRMTAASGSECAIPRHRPPGGEALA